MQAEPVATIAHVIQLSVAPVFLLTGIAGLLNVLTGRLGRVIDRARLLERSLVVDDASLHPAVHDTLRILATRARWINIAISLCAGSAILVASVVMVLFASAFWAKDSTTMVAGLFIAAMIALICGLVFFLREIYLATSSLRIGAHCPCMPPSSGGSRNWASPARRPSSSTPFPRRSRDATCWPAPRRAAARRSRSCCPS
jgi:hypothetical protein